MSRQVTINIGNRYNCTPVTDVSLRLPDLKMYIIDH